MNTISGIYNIVNTKNGKFYVGSAMDINQRWNRHKNALKKNKHENLHLQRAYNKYGEDAFYCETIEETTDLLLREQHYLDTLKPYDINIGYNIGKQSSGGDNLTNHPHRTEIIEKMTVALNEKISKMSEEERKEKWGRDGETNPNWKGGMTFCECGNRINSNTLQCMECIDRSGENNSFYGKRHSDETKELLSQKHMGKKLSSETKEKCKQASIDFYNSDEGKQYLKEFSKRISGENHPLYGIGHTEESQQKMSKTRIDNLNNMSIEERYKWNKMRKVRVVRIQNSYYFSLTEAMKHYSKSDMSLRFRCDSTNDKWKEYEFINITNYTDEQDIDMIRKLTDTSLTPILHT